MADQHGTSAVMREADAKGVHRFTFTYDDTGEVVTVEAPNGWTMQRVVEEAYAALGEAVQPDDRVEFDGKLLSDQHRQLHVKEFIETSGIKSLKLHIVSRPGGAAA